MPQTSIAMLVSKPLRALAWCEIICEITDSGLAHTPIPKFRFADHTPLNPAALRAARSARSSGTTLVPSPAAPAPRSLSVLRHASSAAHDGQASSLTHPWCRIQHVVPEEVAQVAVVVVVERHCETLRRSCWRRGQASLPVGSLVLASKAQREGHCGN